MSKRNNINIIKLFLSSLENHLIINQVNEDIGLFYINVIHMMALDQRLNVTLTDESNNRDSNDLFGEIKLPIIKTSSTNKIKDLLSSNQKIIIITDYKNYKKFTNHAITINGYDHVKDIKFFIRENLQIENNNLLNYCIEEPAFIYSEISKFLINKDGYYSDQLTKKETNFILDLRKAIFDIKSKNKNIKILFDKIKEEFKYKKFNFLTY